MGVPPPEEGESDDRHPAIAERDVPFPVPERLAGPVARQMPARLPERHPIGLAPLEGRDRRQPADEDRGGTGPLYQHVPDAPCDPEAAIVPGQAVEDLARGRERARRVRAEL